MKLRRWVCPLVAGIGLLWTAVSVLDPFRPLGSVAGPVLAVSALLLRWMQGRAVGGYVLAAVLAIAYSLAAGVLIEFRGDSSSYFAYLRSASFDRDLDFANEWEFFAGGRRPPNVAGRTINVFSAGPAVLWSPFYLAAHLYVLLDGLSGRDLYAADGFSDPYRRATSLGTIAVVVLGASLLVLMLARERTLSISTVAVAGAFFASPVLYYTYFVPAMSHGVAFGVAAALLWAWDRARREPSAGSWALLGGALGLLSACRWQASVYGVLVALLGVQQLHRNRARLHWLLTGAGAALAGFLPQLLVWKLAYGHWILLEHGAGFFDFSSRHWLDTLISADHGFFNWTPLMLVGFLGLCLGLRSSPLLHGGGLLVFAITAWINGSVPDHDWAGGDAFGARRYSALVPLMAVGLAHTLELSCRLLRRAPLLAPASAILLLGLWNYGFVSHFRARRYPGPAPLERLASDQAEALGRAARDGMGRLAGVRGRALAYEIFSAEYYYRGLNPSGAILLRSAGEKTLLHGWHTGSRRLAPRTFRRALHPEACVSIPLEDPFPLRLSVSARAPEGLERQTLTLAANGANVGSSPLGREWQELAFLVPEENLVPGENAICLRFDDAVLDGEAPVAALVERIQLP